MDPNLPALIEPRRHMDSGIRSRIDGDFRITRYEYRIYDPAIQLWERTTHIPSGKSITYDLRVPQSEISKQLEWVYSWRKEQN